MTLIAVLAALLIEIYQKPNPDWRNFDWFSGYANWLNTRFADQEWFLSWPGLVVIIGLPVLLVAWFFAGDASWFTRVLRLIVAIALLVYCLGPETIKATLTRYFSDMDAGDEEGGFERAIAFSKDEQASDLPQAIRSVSTAVLYKANERYFAVLIWFVLLGPAVALLYRLASLLICRHQETEVQQQWLAKLLFVMDWLPARIMALIYLLAGNLTSGMARMRAAFLNVSAEPRDILVDAGLGAIDVDNLDSDNQLEENYQVLALVKRALFVLLAMIALMTIFGWVFY